MEAEAKCEAACFRRTGDMSRIDRHGIHSQVRLRHHGKQEGEKESWQQQNSKSRLEAFEHTLLPRNAVSHGTEWPAIPFQSASASFRARLAVRLTLEDLHFARDNSVFLQHERTWGAVSWTPIRKCPAFLTATILT